MTGILQFITRRSGATAAIVIGVTLAILLVIYAAPIVKEQHAIRRVQEVGQVETRPAGPEWLATRFGDAGWWPRTAHRVQLHISTRGTGEVARSLRDMRSLEAVHIGVENTAADRLDLAELVQFIADGSAETVTTLGIRSDSCRGVEMSAPAGRQLARLRHLESLSLRVGVTDLVFPQAASFPNLRGLSVTACGRLLGDDAFAALGTLTGLHWLELREFTADPESFRHVRALSNLTYLILADTDCGDRALRHFSPTDWPVLQSVFLQRTRVTDAGLEQIAELRSLLLVDLADTKITDRGVAKLAGMPRLESLTLERTAVTPACLGALRTLPNLKYLYLRGTAIGGVHQRRFREALPDVLIGFTDATAPAD
ncbi:MAG: hypothetical protein WD066_11095 [Planctomycetaceae bacterium]